MTLQKTALTVFIAFATTAPLFAAQPPSRSTGDLEDAQANLSRLAAQTKGTPQHRLLQEQQRIQGLIDDIKAGKTVAPTAIDRALGDAERNGAW
ncbi:MAG TPA: hypothetical protein VKH82_15970 [Candidatus Binatia bacterium]|nr:hypothetical protein [Candidatus Binatia bacterium]